MRIRCIECGNCYDEPDGCVETRCPHCGVYDVCDDVYIDEKL